MENRTEVTQFILLGLTKTPELQFPLFIMFTLIYLINMLGNLGVIVLILIDSRLHTPMYFFLSNLSLVDLCYSSAGTPTVLAGFLSGDNVVSYNACAAQMFFFAGFASVENFLLASMAYDRYAAVCKPLHYSDTMTTGLCVCLAIGSYVGGLVNGSIHTWVTFRLSFCMSNVVHHFFCDVPAVRVLSCSDRHVTEMVLVFKVSFIVFFALMVILISYLFIFITILNMHSAEGYRKALSTCASHFIAVSIFYGARILVYMQLSSSHSMDKDKMASMFYTMVIPMINPLVYSLRNKDVHSAFQKVIEKAKLSLCVSRTSLESQITSMENRTEVTQFILLGLTNALELLFPLFTLFTLIYLINVLGNLGVIVLILLDSRRHTPMYFFLSNLSLVDPCYSSAVTPTVLAGFLTGDNVISYNVCAAQMFFFAGFASVEDFLLAAMAYDRYAAVCKPLHYTTPMTTGDSAIAEVSRGPIAELGMGRVSLDSQPISVENRTDVTRFILLGLTSAPELQFPLFMMFTFIYFINVLGNLGMIGLILLDSRLHTPMYFFLSNLPLVDLCYSSAVTPTVLAGFLTGDNVISYNACAAQMFFFAVFIAVENFLLASMAYDHYAAVCKPLHYTNTMTTVVCAHLAIGSYAGGFLNGSIHIGDAFHLSFCMSNVVHRFFCDLPAVMVLSCSDTSEMVLVFVVSFNIFSAFLVISISYMFIFITILKTHLAEGYRKALSTCASHLTAVSIFYGTSFFMYTQPSSSHSMDTDKMASMFYTMVIPMLNPLVYSLRNKDVKSAFEKIIENSKLSLGLVF
ncbi:LOW QUALITY PROTEIN: uncharacterized protein PS065_010269 [Dugong dugon]